MSSTRQEVMAHLTQIAAEAMARGEDGMKAVEAACPGIPLEVAVQAEMAASDAQTEAWWSGVERTIDGELIRRALTSPASDPPA